MMSKSHYAVNINYALLRTPDKLLRSRVRLIISYTMFVDTEARGRPFTISNRKMSCSNTSISTHTSIFGDIRTKEYIFCIFLWLLAFATTTLVSAVSYLSHTVADFSSLSNVCELGRTILKHAHALSSVRQMVWWWCMFIRLSAQVFYLKLWNFRDFFYKWFLN